MSSVDEAVRDAVANADVYSLRAAVTAVLTACHDLEAVSVPTSSERTAWVVRGQLANALGVQPDLAPRLVIDAPVSSQDAPPAPAREWKSGDQAIWRGRVIDIVGISTDGQRVAIDDLGEVLFDRDVTELSEVPVSTDPDGGDR